MNGAIAIFVKTPGHSPLKTRLARVLGAADAAAWHLLAAAATASVARRAVASRPAALYWAVAEDGALGDPCWSALPRLAQGGGDLGERMQRVHAELVRRHGAGVLVGADTPQLGAGMLEEALAWLAAPAPRCALGPASDGGFWLFGANREVPAMRWTAVPYGAPDTAARFRATLADAGRWRELATLTDVDEAPHLVACAAALDACPEPTPEQATLRAWMAARGVAADRPA